MPLLIFGCPWDLWHPWVWPMAQYPYPILLSPQIALWAHDPTIRLHHFLNKFSKKCFPKWFSKTLFKKCSHQIFDIKLLIQKVTLKFFKRFSHLRKKKKNTYEIFTKTLLGYFSLKKKLMKYLLKCKNPFIFSTYNSWDFHQKPFYAIFIQKLVRF